MVLTPLPPERFLKALKPRARERLARAEVGLLGDHPWRVPVHELSLVNADAAFDLEAAQVWQGVIGTTLDAERLYLFEAPPLPQGE